MQQISPAVVRLESYKGSPIPGPIGDSDVQEWIIHAAHYNSQWMGARAGEKKFLCFFFPGHVTSRHIPFCLVNIGDIGFKPGIERKIGHKDCFFSSPFAECKQRKVRHRRNIVGMNYELTIRQGITGGNLPKHENHAVIPRLKGWRFAEDRYLAVDDFYVQAFESATGDAVKKRPIDTLVPIRLKVLFDIS